MTTETQSPQPAPVVVAPDANADEMNRLHGEAYGTDWVYPEQPDTLDVVLDEDAADTLRQTIGDAEEAAPVRLQVGYGHSGHGLYASHADYPEEGAVLIRATKPPAISAPEGGERAAFEAWGRASRLEASDGERGMNYPLGAHLWKAWQARAALAAPAPQASAWQPIETAPKDGRDLLLWESGSYVPFVGAWRDGRRPGWHCDTEHYNTDGDACVISNLWQEGVTHWMPLPAAPQTKEPTNDR